MASPVWPRHDDSARKGARLKWPMRCDRLGWRFRNSDYIRRLCRDLRSPNGLVPDHWEIALRRAAPQCTCQRRRASWCDQICESWYQHRKPRRQTAVSSRIRNSPCSFPEALRNINHLDSALPQSHFPGRFNRTQPAKFRVNTPLVWHQSTNVALEY
jgi:hypothetical protein